MDPRSLQDLHSASNHKSRLRRWLVVCMYMGYLLGFVGSEWAYGTSHDKRLFGLLNWYLVSDISLYIFVACWLGAVALVFSQTSRMIHLPVERQRAMRDRMNRYAYPICALLFTLLALYVGSRPYFSDRWGLALPLPVNPSQGTLITLTAAFILMTLPTSIMAWMKRA